MNKTKKIISIVLALVLVASIGTIMLVSNAGDNTPTTAIAVTVDKTELKAGESAIVTVKATTNYAVGTMSIPVFYDKTLVTVSDGTVALAEYETKNVTTDLTAVDTSKIYDNTNIDSEKFGFVLASYIAGANSIVQTMLEDVVVLTFKITAKADVSGTAAVKVVTESAKTTNNIAGMLYFGKQPDGNTIDAIPENIEGINVDNASVSVTIGNGTPILAVKDGFDSVIIDTYADAFFGFESGITGVIYGIETLGYATGFETFYALADVLTTTEGDEYLQITASDDVDGYESTGSLIEVIDGEGNVLETYYFVYFGDMNGDGYIDNGDATAAETYALDDSIDSVYAMLAGDANADTYTDNGDATTIATAVLNDADYPVQEDIAALYWETILPEYEMM